MADRSTTEKGSSNNPLEQFVLLAKSAKGAAAAELIKQALEANGVYVFSELLEMPNIKELEGGPYGNYYNLLKLFAYGTYQSYIINKDSLPELSPAQIKKLRHLTVITLATEMCSIPYDRLCSETGVHNIRQLEDLLIEAIYADIIRGKLDQKKSCLEISYSMGRDVEKSRISVISNALRDWCDACEGVISDIETQIAKANHEKNQYISHKLDVENQLLSIKKQLKIQMQEEENMIIMEKSDSTFEKPKKSKHKAVKKFSPRL